MVDQLLYRLNRVPDRHYLKFLDLIGVRLFPPAAARADLTFWLSAPPHAAGCRAGRHGGRDRAHRGATSRSSSPPIDELRIVAVLALRPGADRAGRRRADRPHR